VAFPVTTEQKLSSPFLSGPGASPQVVGAIVVSSLFSSVYVLSRSSAFGSMRRCRSRTWTLFGELLSRVLMTAEGRRFDSALGRVKLLGVMVMGFL